MNIKSCNSKLDDIDDQIKTIRDLLKTQHESPMIRREFFKIDDANEILNNVIEVLKNEKG